jgi:hypothetical protein
MIKLGDDGNVFWCDECGAEVQRTRDNPMPEVIHRKDCPALKSEGSDNE